MPPAHDQSWDDIKHEVDDKDLVILHTSTPSFRQDVHTAELIKARNPTALIGLIGAKVAVEPEVALRASTRDRFRLPQRIRLHREGGGGRQAARRGPGGQLSR